MSMQPLTPAAPNPGADPGRVAAYTAARSSDMARLIVALAGGAATLEDTVAAVQTLPKRLTTVPDARPPVGDPQYGAWYQDVEDDALGGPPATGDAADLQAAFMERVIDGDTYEALLAAYVGA